jgi:hypothetical protein
MQSYGVYSQNKKVLAEPKGLFFGTAVSLSYAIGSGTVAGAVVGPSANGDVELRANPADVLAHEFTLHIASTLSE